MEKASLTKHKEKQTAQQIDRHMDGQKRVSTQIPMDGNNPLDKTDRQKDRWTKRQSDSSIDIPRWMKRQTDDRQKTVGQNRQTDRQLERQTNRPTDSWTDR